MAKLRKINGHYVLTDIKLNLTNEMYLDINPNNSLDVSVSLVDNRKITEQQRKFIFALCNEISYFTGDDKEYIRLLMQQYNANLKGIEVASLSNCSMTYANGLIDTIINYCIDNEIPISGEVIKDNQYHFTEKQTYMMCLKRICVICGKRADIHHVDRVGMGNNRKKISHVGMKVLPLCREHHQLAHNMSNEAFLNKYVLTPVVVDKKMDYFIKNGKLKIHREDMQNEQ
jgi:hypothetical protein